MMSLKKHYVIVFIAIIIVCSFSLNALAVNDIDELNAELNKQQTKQTYNQSNIWLDFLKLVLVLGLIVLAAWSIIKIFGRQMTNKMQGTWIHVVDEVTLGQNRGIVLCEVGEKLYAIGITDHNINLLFEINNPKLLEEISFSQPSVETNTSFNTKDIKDYVTNRFKINKSSNNNQEFRALMDEQFSRLEKLSDNMGRNETKEEVMK